MEEARGRELGQECVSLWETDLAPDLLSFLRERVNSFVKLDLVCFFHENPHTADTAENIARYVGRDVEAMRSDLSELAQEGVLSRQQLGQLRVYSLTDNSQKRRLIERLMKLSNDRRFLVQVVYQVLRSMR